MIWIVVDEIFIDAFFFKKKMFHGSCAFAILSVSLFFDFTVFFEWFLMSL